MTLLIQYLLSPRESLSLWIAFPDLRAWKGWKPYAAQIYSVVDLPSLWHLAASHKYHSMKSKYFYTSHHLVTYSKPFAIRGENRPLNFEFPIGWAHTTTHHQRISARICRDLVLIIRPTTFF